MSSCAVSCCTCFPKALSAFATLASSPTGGAPLYSALLSTTRSSTAIADRTKHFPCSGTEPELTLALSQVWRKDGGHRETYRCPDPTPFSALSRRSRRMIRPFRPPLPGASHHLPPWSALLAPKPAPHFKPRAQSLTPTTSKLQPNPSCFRFYQLQYLFPKPLPETQHH